MRLIADPQIRALVDLALHEDIGTGDVTSLAVLADDAKATGAFVARQSGVVAGLPLVEDVIRLMEPEARVTACFRDGDRFDVGATLAEVEGNAQAILAVERTALNFLQRLCGIATATARFVEAVKPYPVRIVDLRKTIPGWRALSKYAVRVGGGRNHRFGLYDGILIKDNHIAVAGSVKEAVRRARERAPHTLRVEVEVDTLDQLDEALDAGADIILLDNMTFDELAVAVARTNGRAVLEASGGIGIETVRAVAATGVDVISSSHITNAPPLDIGFDV
jgi:nicotinate-nucleotide pyrophosphorylase (carboxylating)